MSPDDLWALGLRANGATGRRPPWLLISHRQWVRELAFLSPLDEALHRAWRGMTLPADPEGDETFAEMAERVSGPEGYRCMLAGPFVYLHTQHASGSEWDGLTDWVSEADYRRWLKHTYVLSL